MANQTIAIQCKGADVLPLDAIEEFQGNLKKRTKADIEKIIVSISKYGFSFPFFVWNGDGHNRCLDGHGRLQALCEMRPRNVVRHDLFSTSFSPEHIKYAHGCFIVRAFMVIV